MLRARELGFSLDEIRELLRLVDERDRPCAEARDVAAEHLDDMRAKIADLKRMERVLKDVVRAMRRRHAAGMPADRDVVSRNTKYRKPSCRNLPPTMIGFCTAA